MNRKLSWKRVVRQIVLIICAGIILFPFLWMFFASFKEESEVFAKDFHLLPEHWRFANYIDAWNAAPFGRFYMNSLKAALISVVCQTCFCSMAGYAFAKIQFPGKKTLFSFMLAMMILPEEAAIIPNYLLAQDLGLINTSFGIAMMTLVSVFNIFLLRQTFMTIPNDLIYASKIDGCNELQSFCHVVLPCARSSVATLALLAFLDSWNAYMWPMVVTYQNTTRTLQIGLKYLIKPDLGPQWPMIMAASTFILLPVLLLFVGLQRYFVEGMVKTGIK